MKQSNLALALNAGIVELGLAVPPGAPAVLAAYIELLHQWNQHYNLTAVRDPQAMVSRHVLDSLAAAPYVRGARVLDVGTGAGLPGIPLAVAFPEKRFTLLDSNGKKIRFVTHAVTVLGLKNVQLVQTRAEDYRPAEAFATVISRACARLSDFLLLTAHLCAADGRWLAMKAAPSAAELQDLPAGFRLTAMHLLKVPDLDAKRCVVEIEKSEEVRREA